MSFVPVTGPATFRAAEPPRDGVVEFTDERRTVSLPIRAALPVLTKARPRDDLHPSVGLLSGAALLAMRLVAAGKFAPARQPAELAGGRPGRRRRGPDRDAGAGAGTDDEAVVRGLLDAVADAMPRSRRRRPPRCVAPRRDRQPTFEQRLQARLARHQRHDPRDLPQLVTHLAAGRGRRGGAGRGRRTPGAAGRTTSRTRSTSATLALLWTDTPDEHGFGDRARTHATIALRAAADAWPVLDRLLELRVPDEIALDTDELVSLLEDGRRGAAERRRRRALAAAASAAT